ncbi:MAG: peptidoglycan DD-metalloendopeptidase family protein [Eubacteriales bacterium]
MPGRKNHETDKDDENKFNISENETLEEVEINTETADSEGIENQPISEDIDIFDEFDVDFDIDLSDDNTVNPELTEKAEEPERDDEDENEDDNENIDDYEDESENINQDDNSYNDREHVGGSLEFLKEDNEPEYDGFKNNRTNKMPGIFLPFASIGTLFYNFCYILGTQTFRYGKWVFKRLHKLIMKPLRYFYALSRIFVLGIDRLFFKSVHTVHEDAVLFRKEIRSSIKYLRIAIKKDPSSIISILSHYAKKTIFSHKDMFRSAFNLAMPVISLLIFWLTVSYWNSVTYALKVTYADNPNSYYIQDESVYVKAQALALDVMNPITDTDTSVSTDSVTNTAEKTEKSAVDLEKPSYELALVKLNQLSDETVIYDSLIENPASSLVNACGIYIDGVLEFAVQNETDATGVFEDFLAEDKKENSNAIVTFVEDVKLTQGFYDDSIVLDAAELSSKLKTKKTEADYYTVKDGDTVSGIADDKGIALSDLLSMNKNLGDGMNIHIGDKLLVASEVNYLRIKIIKTETTIEDVEYETIKTTNSSLFRGDTRTIRKGVNGKDQVTASVTYVDGEIVGTPKIISRTRLFDPISEKIQVGIKSTMVFSHSGSYNVSVSREGFVWPVPSCHSISSYYGYRWGRFHYAVDIAGSGTNGKLVVASKDGTVEFTGWESGGGNTIIINHGGGVKTKYCHLLSGSTSVGRGQYVSAGQAIARVGSTGNATGPHLHFEVIVNGYRSNPLSYV